MEQMPKETHVRLIVWFGGLLFGESRQGLSWPVSLALLVITLVGQIPSAWADDVVGTIAMDGVPVTITTTVSGQNAVLTFDATSGQRVSLEVPGKDPDRRVSIYRPNGTLITSSSSYWGQFFDALTLDATGTYRIVADLDGTLTGSVTFKLHSVPADVISTIAADAIPVVVQITTPGQNGAVTFNGDVGQRITLNVPGQSPPRTVRIYKPDNSLLASSSSYWGQLFDALVLPDSGTYKIVVDPDDAYIGNVTLKLYNVPADVISTIAADAVPVVVQITTPGQNASITFNGDVGQRITLNVPGVNPRRNVYLYKPDGSLLTSSSGYYGQLFDALILLASGTYKIVVDPDEAYIGNVTLTLYNVPADATATVTLNSVAVVATTVPGQNAAVTFSANAGQRITLDVPGVNPRRRVSLYDPNGALLVTSSAYYGPYFERLTLAAAGTYRIFIDPSEVGTGTVTVKLYDLLPDPTAEIGANGIPVVMTTTVPGQHIFLTFNGNAGQRISLSVPGVFPDRWVYLYAPDGTTLASSSGYYGQYFGSLLLPASGTYTIKIDISGSTIGSVGVTLFDITPVLPSSLAINGPPVTLTTTAPGQTAAVTFNATASQQVTVHVTGNSMGCPVVSLVSPGGTTLVSSNSCAAGTTLAMQTLSVTGTYTINVAPPSPNIGCITIRVSSP
jgi:hypothetical protein